MDLCYDNGLNGDETAGDFVFSRVVTFSDTLLSGGVIYKFGAQYPEAGTISASGPLDNSKGVGQNFSFILRAVDTTVVLMETWPLRQSDITGVKEIGGLIPSQYTLEQNYPNPFNPSTTIRYSIPVESKVSLKIFDMLGREVKTLVSKEVAAGSYSVNWNGDDNFGNKVSTGAYVYRITAGDPSASSGQGFVSVKKMLLIK